MSLSVSLSLSLSLSFSYLRGGCPHTMDVRGKLWV